MDSSFTPNLINYELRYYYTQVLLKILYLVRYMVDRNFCFNKKMYSFHLPHNPSLIIRQKDNDNKEKIFSFLPDLFLRLRLLINC